MGRGPRCPHGFFPLPATRSSISIVPGGRRRSWTRLEALAEALEALPERERDVIVLHYYHGLTLKEVAIHMRLAYSTVKLCHNRTLERLQQMLAPEEATV